MGDFLRHFMGPYRRSTVLALLTKSVEVVFDLITPLVIAHMIDVGVAQRDVTVILRSGGLLLVLTLVGFGFTLICQRLAAAVSQGICTDARSALFSKVNELSGAELDALGTANLVTNVTSDVNQVQVAIALAIRQGIRWPFIALGSMFAALLIDLRLGLVFLVCTPAIAVVFWLVMTKSVPLFRRVQEALVRLTRVCSENLEGVRVVRAFGKERYEERRFEACAREQRDLSLIVNRLSALLNPATFLILNLGVVAILWQGAGQVDSGRLTQGQIVAFVNYMTQMLLAIVYVANLVVIFTRGSASASRVMDVLDLEPYVRDEAAQRIDLVSDKNLAVPALTLDNVSFAYSDSSEDALHELSLTLSQGGRLGVIGGTGSGKSTLANLLVRLYDPREGSIKLLGHDLRDYPFEQLRELVAHVSQEPSLVSGILRSNLLWRDETASYDELWLALELAQAADFVRQKPQGLDTPVEAGGTNFSGGQRQRLTIARALVGKARLLVLDDVSSALDFATDARLRRALESLEDVSTVTISQRVSTIKDCDLILVLHHGAVAGLGTHDELLSSCELYREIASSQLIGEGEVA